MLSLSESEQDLQTKQQQALEDYVENLLGRDAFEYVVPEAGYIDAEIVRDRWREERVSNPNSSDSYKTIILHSQLVFDEQVRREFMDSYKQVVQRQRLWQSGGAAAAVILVLSTLLGYFQLDTATKGYYTGRLQLAATAVILTIGGGLLYYWQA